MGAAWKGVTEHDAKFASVLETVREVAKLGMEVCVTLGQLTPEAARQLRAAGVTAYNHNLDTSPEFYPNIVTTHTFEDRLATIRSVQAAGMSVCCGGIIGMGETELDRLKMLEVLCGFNPAPESVPINCLMPMAGTPLDGQPPVDIFQLVRLIATTRLALPKARVRLSAGRTRLTREGQVLCGFDPAPESVPINCLMPMEGTPLAEQPPVDIFQLVRLIAVTRLVLPKARVRLSAGRTRLTREGQALCFFAGANSIFYGDKLLTAANPGVDSDHALLHELGLGITKPEPLAVR
jgi:biotin synthase-like enzyme